MIRAPGCSRRARRIAWRAWRSASAVTAQVLTMTASPSPASAAARRMMSLSNALSRQPKVMIATPAIASPGEQGGIEAAFESERRRPGHHHMPVGQPAYLEFPAVERDRRLPSGQPAAVGRDQRSAGAAAAGLGDPGAALPDAHPDPRAFASRRAPDIGALGKQRIMFEPGAERGKIDRLGI